MISGFWLAKSCKWIQWGPERLGGSGRTTAFPLLEFERRSGSLWRNMWSQAWKKDASELTVTDNVWQVGFLQQCQQQTLPPSEKTHGLCAPPPMQCVQAGAASRTLGKVCPTSASLLPDLAKEKITFCLGLGCTGLKLDCGMLVETYFFKCCFAMSTASDSFVSFAVPTSKAA